MSGGLDGQAAGSATTVEACEGCTRAVHESGTSGAGWCRGARDYAVVHEIAEWCMSTSGARCCTRLRSGARDRGVVHDGTRVEVLTARQREVPRQLRKLVTGARDYGVVHNGTRVVHDGAQDYVVVHEIVEWCTMVNE